MKRELFAGISLNEKTLSNFKIGALQRLACKKTIEMLSQPLRRKLRPRRENIMQTTEIGFDFRTQPIAKARSDSSQTLEQAKHK